MQLRDTRGVDDLKALGAGRPAPEAIARLYRRAFAEFGARAFWSRKPVDQPTITQALTVADALRVEGICERVLRPSRSKRCAVPFSELQSEILRLSAKRPKPRPLVSRRSAPV